MNYERITQISAQRTALKMLLREFASAEQASLLQMLSAGLADPQERQNLIFYQATKRTGELAAVALAQLQPGGIAVLWPARGVKEAYVPLLRALLADLKSLHTVMVQALLPLDAVADIAMLEGVGVSAITELVYMVAERDAFPTEPPPMSELQWEVADPAATRFQNLVRATYQGSLDCPQIDGWRSIQDVLTGYATVGKYRPDLWQIGCVGETEIGCLILADYPTQKQWELVYLGVHPQQRGRGWGAFFVQSLLWNARNEGVERVVLAVDLANKPARKVYFEGGFREFERRLVLAHKL